MAAPTNRLDIDKMQRGQMYRVVFLPPSGKGRNMEMTARFLGENHLSEALDFDQRPKAGTTTIPTRSIIELHSTDADKVSLPHRVNYERRVL